jgi:uncharacterized MAPEG superfamily protein
MTFAYWCVLVAACLPYLWVIFAKFKPGYNNHTPREFLSEVEGWRKRANWAQVNAFESFPAFAAAVIISHLAKAPQESIDLHAGLFLVFRLLHGAFYIADKASLRSMVWAAGFICMIRLFTIAA